jgi:hypothetical protein
MRQARWIALILTVVIPGLAVVVLADGTSTPEPVDQARALIAAGEFQKAATLLEERLPEANRKDRGALVDLLRQSYRSLIKQAEAAGKTAEAAAYRDDLAILGAGETRDEATLPPPPRRDETPAARPEKTSPAATAEPETQAPAASGLRPLPRTSAPAEAANPVEPSPEPDPGPLLAEPQTGIPKSAARQEPASEPPAGSLSSPEKVNPPSPPADPSLVRPTLEPSPAGGPSSLPRAKPGGGPSDSTADDTDLNRADQLFNTKKYEEAGRVYARLAAANQLPLQRKQIWAYCRWVAVVSRINAPPRDGREWDAIEQEIRSIQRLTPGNWYGEYLQNRVAEARRATRGPARGGRLVVRGSEPEEPSRRPPGLVGRVRSGVSAPPPAEPAVAPAMPLGLPAAPGTEESTKAAVNHEQPSLAAPSELQQPTPEVAAPADPTPQPQAEQAAPPAASPNPAPAAPLDWQVRQSANFRIYHVDPALAEKASVAAESVRSQQARRWGSSATRSTWTPPCEIYLYPTPRQFAEMTGQSETSPGFSTMGLNGNKITARRVNLRADHPQLLTAILPHEVTHVVLADLFTQQQIPRWADEGMAVLAEPLAEQISRAAELTGPLSEGKIFKLNELMAIDYPNTEAWNLYYAQSVSLTQFLVDIATPEQFVRFLRSAQREGVEAALREVYRINGFADLENRWQRYARRQVAEIATTREPSAGTAAARR